MFGSAILDVGIGLIFIFLLFSLICSAISEIIEAVLKGRASNLEKGVRELLTGDLELTRKLYDSPFIKGLGEKPSYIPARNFALALLDHIAPASETRFSGAAGALATGRAPDSSPDLRNSTSSLENTQLRSALLTLIDASGNDMIQVRQNIEEWYNSAMDRVSGWYKRRTQWMIFFIGLVSALVYNIDTINIAQYLSTDSTVRNSLVAAAQAYASQPNAANSAQERFTKNLETIRDLGLPLGWRFDKGQVPNDLRALPHNPPGFMLKFVGCCLSAFAVSLGAPFWFDLLNKFIVVRSTVKPKEKSPEEQSKD